jgi:hypothetical protein
MVSPFLLFSAHYSRPSLSPYGVSLTRNERRYRNLGSQRDGEIPEEIANDQAPRLELIRAVRG